MTNQVWMGTAMLAATAVVAAAQPASDTDARIAALEAQRAEIDARIDAIKSDRRPWLDPLDVEEVRALAREAIADSATRASFLDDRPLSGYDGGFFIRSGDGNFLLRINSLIQFRYVFNHRDDAPGDGSTGGFEMRRTRLNLNGHAFDPALTWRVQGDFNRSTGDLRLLDAWVAYQFNDALSLRFGQFRPGFLREDNTSSSRGQTIERSLVNARFAQNYAQGVELMIRPAENVRLSGGFIDGFRSLNTPFQTATTEWTILGRADVLLVGDWRQFNDFASWSDEEFGLRIGGGLAWSHEEFGTPDPELEFIRWTVDAAAKFGGVNLFGALVGNHWSIRDGDSGDDWGAVVQGGVFVVPDTWELFGRWEWGTLDLPGVSDLSIITVGVNRFFRKHNLRWSTDIGYGFKPVAPEWAATSAGWRADAPDEDGQVVVRSQVQIAF